MNPIRINLADTALLVVDVQDKLLPHMHNAQEIVVQAGRLLDAAKLLGLKVLVTEQYQKGLGSTIPELRERWPRDTPVYEKLRFSAMVTPVAEKLRAWNIRTVLVCGIEGHVCILQTCLDLLGAGWPTMLVVDAIGSRRKLDQEMAVQRLVQAGVIPTTVESAILELVGEAGTLTFKAILPLIK